MPASGKDREKVLEEYLAKVETLKAIKSQHKEIQPLQIADVLYIRAVLHPTSRSESRDMTRELVTYICNKRIVTAQDIYDEFGWSDKPVMRRLKLFREFGLVRREGKKYYIPTPKMVELRERYLERVCG